MKKKIIDEIHELLDSCDTITLKAIRSALKDILSKGESHEY